MDGSLIELEREKFKSLCAGIKEGVILVSPKQDIVWANELAATLTGYKTTEMVGKIITDILYMLDSNDQVVSADQLCPTGGLDTEGALYKASNVSLVDKKDIVRVINIQSRKIKEGSKIDLGAIVIIDNVFQESELERMKSDFVSMAVHMLRTPLTVIKGFLSNLLSMDTVKKLTRSELDNLTSAIAGTDELNMLVENLLHLSEIQTGSFKIYPTPVNYEGLIASVVNEFKPAVESKGLKLFYIPSLNELPMLKIDFARIREVLRNILDNAIKYTDTGGIEIGAVREGDFIHTTIKDTGKGIPPQNLEYIFTKFYRVKDPLAMQEGLGLGLFISKKIIETHRGKIWAESIENQGSVFHFTLPISA